MSNPAPLRKAAILLMSLPQEEAAKILTKLDAKQVEAVASEIAKLGRLNGDEQEAAINDFCASNPKAMGNETGGLDVAKILVEKALGKNATSTLENVRQSIEAVPFGFLKKVDPQDLLTFIIDEHPQTIALILSHLPSSYGAQIMGHLPTDRQLQVIRRIAHMGDTSPEVIKQVESGLETRMSSLMSQQYEKVGGVERVAEILNVTDRQTERSLMENLAQEDPDLVEEIRRLMFVFEDIIKLGDKDVQEVLKNVESQQWALSLKNASEDLKTKVLGNMSSKAAEMLKEEMEYLGPVRVSDVEKMQQQIVDVVRRLEDAGLITVHSGEEEEQFV